MSALDCFAESTLQACAEGRLERTLEAEVRNHCAACPDCRQVLRDYERLEALLTDVPAVPAGPAPAVWPAVRARLHPQPSPWARLALSLGSAAAVAAGLLIGFLLVPWQDDTPPAAWEQNTWTEMGSLLADPSSYGNLDTIYWDLASDEGGGSR